MLVVSVFAKVSIMNETPAFLPPFFVSQTIAAASKRLMVSVSSIFALPSIYDFPNNQLGLCSLATGAAGGVTP